MGKMKQVRRMLEGQDPKGITKYFLERSIILAQEAKMSKEDFLAYIEKCWK